MHISRFTSILLLAAMLCLAVASTAHAGPVTYSYLGLPFDSAGSPWTTSDFISGSLTVSAAFAANLSLGFFAGGNSLALVTSYSLSDGLYTWNPSDSVVGDLNVATDSFGTITRWFLSINGDNGFPGSLLFLSGCAGCAPGGSTGDSSSAVAGGSASNNASGAWSPVSSVPEPSGVILLAIGVGMIGALKRRRSAGSGAGL